MKVLSYLKNHFNLLKFKNIHIFFKMFDNYEEIGKALIALLKENTFLIKNIIFNYYKK